LGERALIWYNAKVMKYVSFILLLSILLSPVLPSTAEDIALKVEKRLHSLNSLKSDFVQVYYSISVSTPLEEKGKFYFQKPDSMKWEYEDPEKKIFLYKDKKFLFFLPEDNQLIRSSLSQENQETELFEILSGQKHLQDWYHIEFSSFPSEKKNPLQLKLTPREENEFSFILLEIDEKTWLIEKAIFFDWAGNKTEFWFKKIKTNVRFPQNTFELEVPPDVEIIEKI